MLVFYSKTDIMTDMVDGKDKKILEILRKDSRMHTKEIARKTGIPRATVHERIKKMRKEGVIRRFTVLQDYKKLGLPVTCFVMVLFEPGGRPMAKVGEDIARLAGVTEVFQVGGDVDLLVKVKGESLEWVGNLVIGKIRALSGVKRTKTITVFGTVKEGV